MEKCRVSGARKRGHPGWNHALLERGNCRDVSEPLNERDKDSVFFLRAAFPSLILAVSIAVVARVTVHTWAMIEDVASRTSVRRALYRSIIIEPSQGLPEDGVS